MLKISSAQFLFIMEIIAVSAGAALFFFFRYRKLKTSLHRANAAAPGAPEKDRSTSAEKPPQDARDKAKKEAELSEWKGKFDTLQRKFDEMKEVNEKLKDLINTIMPESSEAKNMQQLLDGMTSSKEELDACIGGLKEQMRDMGQQIVSYRKQVQAQKKEAESWKEETTQLKRKLKDTVKKADYDKIEADRNRLTIRVEQLEKQLKERNEEFKKMEKEHMWLEKEYNRIYNNIDDEYEANLKEAAAKKSAQQPAGEPVEG